MSKILYACGDSFMFGMECLGDKSKTQANKQLAFPKYLSDMLNCDQYINNSICGATNEFIFRQTVLDLINFEKQGINPNEVFVVVGITTLHRIEIDGERFYEPIVDKVWLEQQYSNEFFPKEFQQIKKMLYVIFLTTILRNLLKLFEEFKDEEDSNVKDSENKVFIKEFLERCEKRATYIISFMHFPSID